MPGFICVTSEPSRPWLMAAVSQDISSMQKLKERGEDVNQKAFFRFNNPRSQSENLERGTVLDMMLCELFGAIVFYPNQINSVLEVLEAWIEHGGKTKKFNKYTMNEFVIRAGDENFTQDAKMRLFTVFQRAGVDFTRKTGGATLMQVLEKIMPEVLEKHQIGLNIPKSNESSKVTKPKL